MKTYQRVIFSLCLMFALAIVLAPSVLAVTPSASSTMDTILGAVISSVVDLATIFFTTYWPYLLVAALIVAFIVGFKKLLHGK